MRLIIVDYSHQKELNEAILRYYTLLRMSFDTNIYKLFERVDSQIYRFAVPQGQKPTEEKQSNVAEIQFECPKCKNKFLIQANLEKNVLLKKNALPYPIDDEIFKCPSCGTESNINQIRLQIESQSGKKVIK